jgi:hypothetical protein
LKKVAILKTYLSILVSHCIFAFVYWSGREKMKLMKRGVALALIAAGAGKPARAGV